MKTIYIIGAGAIGRALAVFLTIQGKEVVLLRGSIDDQSDSVERITVELGENEELQADVRVSTLSNFSTFDGIVVLATKSFGNADLAETLKAKMHHSPLVILQNGLDVEVPFLREGFKSMYRCVLFTSIQPVAHNRIRFKPVAASLIGPINGDKERLPNITLHLNNNYFEFKSEEDIQPVIWSKAIVNCAFNSICPLLETDNGIFYRDKKALEVAKRIIKECIAVASLKQIPLDFNKILDRLLLISKSSDGQLISTLQDIQQQRRTEIETLNFAVASIANDLGKGELVKETTLLGELIQIKSAINISS